MLKTEEDIKKFISTLPTTPDGNSNTNLYQYQGFWYHSYYLELVISAQTNFNPNPNTTILCSYPKTGTTWLKALSFAISNRTHNHNSPSQSPLLTELPHNCVPFIELLDHNQQNPQSQLLSTHIPYTSLPPSASTCKLIYICRDPKDVFVSMWHFRQKQKEATGVIDTMGIEDGFEQFCLGFSIAGPYWDHVLGYWKASLEYPDRVLFVKYEELKSETVKWVKKLAEFLGCGFSMEEEEDGSMEKVIEMCGIEKLKGLEVSKDGCYLVDTPFAVPNSSFYRKGEVGDWRNCISGEMADRLDRIMEDKLGGFGFKLWSSHASMAETTT
ncbi:Cytosolic sulfotransferase 16 [Linum perenne]